MVAETNKKSRLSFRNESVAAKPRVTLWGLNDSELHKRFWAARGVAVVCPGDLSPVENERAELYLLTDRSTLVLFRLRVLVDLLSWSKPRVLYVRLRSSRMRAYRESPVVDRQGEFVRIQRGYGHRRVGLARVAFTTDRALAAQWQSMPDTRSAWQMLRRCARTSRREATTISGHFYDRTSDHESAEFVRDLAQFWKHPDSTIPGLKLISPGVWAHETSAVAPETKFIGAAWIGAGRSTTGSPFVLGPAMLWDCSTQRISAVAPAWHDIEPRESYQRRKQPIARSRHSDFLKRAFDIVFASMILILTSPLLLLTMIAIWLEDGRPFFFSHRRETRGGREFECLKFRSMRKDADAIKAKLVVENQADGPQFFMASDPRVTKVGKFIRRTNIDELPQFINVLLGHMSIVGPRPSPYSENQFCPSWREARLSVLPGITGLWQVRRTRQRGLDFQEWIKFDLEYVETRSFRGDVSLVLETVWMILGRKRG